MKTYHAIDPMKTKLQFFLFFLLIISSFFGFAQNKKGRIEGTVRDISTNEVMPYTTVYLLGTTYGAATDDKGFYSIKLVTPGTYKLKASFVGYQDTTFTVDIIGDKVTTQDIEISFESTMEETITVTAQALGQIKAINTQLSSNNIKNVVSEAKIRELPDANAAEALSRLPGVSVDRVGGEATNVRIRGVSSNTVYVNGMRMDGGLGAVAPTMVGSIELSKAFLPDQDADVLGGSVDFKMREADKGFNKEISYQQGFNNFNKSFNMREGAVILSNRFFKDKLGVMCSFNYDRRNRGRDSYDTYYRLYQQTSSENSYDVSDILITQATLSKVENINTRYGLTIFTDYKFSFGRIYYQGFFANLTSDNVAYSNSYSYGNSTNYDATGFTRYEKNRMNGIGTDLNIGIVKVDAIVSLSNRSEETPDQVSYFAHNVSSRNSYGWINPTTTLQQFISADSVKHDINNTVLDILHRNNNKLTSDELGFKLNIEVPYKLGDQLTGYVKFGGKYRNIKRGNNSNETRGNFFSGTKLGWLSHELNQRMPELEMDKYVYNSIDYNAGVFVNKPYELDYSLLDSKLYFAPDFDKIKKAANAINDLLFVWRGADYNDYTNEEQFLAGYIMTGINIGKSITFTPGVRYEFETFTTTAKQLRMKSFATDDPNEQGIIRDTTAGSQVANFCPMIHLKYKPLSWFDARLAYTKTLTRPTFDRMSPQIYEDYASIGSPSVFVGNPLLKPQTNTNYDICLSFYGGKVGLFTVSSFYKYIQDQVFTYSKQVVDPSEFNLPSNPPGILYSTVVNNPYSGYIKGIEFDWQNQFGYLPKPFNGFIVNANIAFMDSKSQYPFYLRTTVDLLPVASGGLSSVTEGVNTSRTTKVIGQPDITCNVGLGYQIGGFSGRISYYYQGFTFTDQVDLANVSRDVNIEPYSRVDVQLSQKIKSLKGLTFYLNISNLTNVHDTRIYTYHPKLIRSDEVYGSSASLGLRFKF